MRVAIDLTPWSNRRGYGRFTRGLVRELVATPRAHEFLLFTDGPVAELESAAGGRCIEWSAGGASPRRLGAPFRRSLSTLAALRRAVAAERPDWLFYPTVYSYFPPPRGCGTIVGIHDVIPEDHPRLVFPDWRDRLRWRLKVWAARRRADAVLTLSQHARDGLIRHFGLAAERICVVEPAPDPVFRPLGPDEVDRELLARFGLAAGEPAIGYLGGLNPHKNLEALVDALGELRRRPALSRLRMLFLSDLEDRFTPAREAVSARVRALALEDAVDFPGYLADGEVVQLLNAVRVLALPSLAEGFGLPAVEAAACGTPVVATRESPLPELLRGGGLFVDPRRPQELVAALAAVLEDAALRARLGAVARERVAHLSWRRAAERFLACLERTAAR